MKLNVLTTDEKIAEIRRLYFSTTRHTIAGDLARAVQLLKSMDTEEERERAAVFMDGLAQMRSDWARAEKRPQPSGQKPSSTAPESRRGAGRPKDGGRGSSR